MQVEIFQQFHSRRPGIPEKNISCSQGKHLCGIVYCKEWWLQWQKVLHTPLSLTISLTNYYLSNLELHVATITWRIWSSTYLDFSFNFRHHTGSHNTEFVSKAHHRPPFPIISSSDFSQGDSRNHSRSSFKHWGLDYPKESCSPFSPLCGNCT